MRKLLFLISLLACSVAQSQIGSWAGLYSSKKGGTPASVSILANNTNTSLTQSVTNTLTSVPAGTLMVITLASAADNVDNPNGAVSSSPTLIWTKQVESKAANSGNSEIWTATFTDGGILPQHPLLQVRGMGFPVSYTRYPMQIKALVEIIIQLLHRLNLPLL